MESKNPEIELKFNLSAGARWGGCTSIYLYILPWHIGEGLTVNGPGLQNVCNIKCIKMLQQLSIHRNQAYTYARIYTQKGSHLVVLLHVLYAHVLNLAHRTHEFGMPRLPPESVYHASLSPSLVRVCFGLPSQGKKKL
jgi:hypothetical protein